MIIFVGLEKLYQKSNLSKHINSSPASRTLQVVEGELGEFARRFFF